MSTATSDSPAGFAERVFQVIEKIEYRPADSKADQEAIYRLRYLAYLREGAISPNESERLTDILDTLPNTWNFGIYLEDELVSAVRLSVISAAEPEAPAMQVFPDILGTEIEAGMRFIDPTRFVTDANAARRVPELPYATLRLAFLAGAYFNADYVLATVRREHQAFYKRIFACDLVCPPRTYPTLTKPVSLMKVHYPTMSEKVARRYPFFHSTAIERRALFDRPPKRRVQSAA